MSSALFSPIRLAGLELPNRLVVSPMCQYSAENGNATDWHLMHLGMLANSGAALVIVEATAVEPIGRITHGCLGLWSDENEAALSRVLKSVRRAGTAKFGIQLAHAARKASAHLPWEGRPLVKAKRKSVADDRSVAVAVRRELACAGKVSEADMARMTEAFVSAAKRALRVGFDEIELHMAHGYLFHGFMSPISNTRTDAYGGSLANRLRFPLAVARAVRAAVPRNVPLGARITGSDWREGGLTADDAVAIAKALKAEGIDFIDVSSGGVTYDTRNPSEPGYNVPIAERIKREAGIATRVVGLVYEPEQAEAIVGDGKADMVAMARAFLDDPHWGWHAAKALGADIPRPPQYLRAGPKLWAPAS